MKVWLLASWEYIYGQNDNIIHLQLIYNITKWNEGAWVFPVATVIDIVVWEQKQRKQIQNQWMFDSDLFELKFGDKLRIHCI